MFYLLCQTQLSDVTKTCVCHDGYLCLTAWTLVFDTSDNCVCQNGEILIMPMIRLGLWTQRKSEESAFLSNKKGG